MTYKEWRATLLNDARRWLQANKLDQGKAIYLANFIENTHERWSTDYSAIDWPHAASSGSGKSPGTVG